MRERFIPAFIMLTAGLITSIINIINKVNLLESLIRLLLVLVLFYVIGLFAKAIVKKALKNNPKVEDENHENDTEDSKDGSKPLEDKKK